MSNRIKRPIFHSIWLIGLMALTSSWLLSDDWGFFAHRRINRLAVFTLPTEMQTLFKSQIDFLTEHAVDPDKRRYATRHEAVRHYIDIDQWGQGNFDHLPRDLFEAVARYSHILLINQNADTLTLKWPDITSIPNDTALLDARLSISYKDFIELVRDSIRQQYYDGPYISVSNLLPFVSRSSISQVVLLDRFSEHGILPYNLITQHHRLKRAFESGQENTLLRLASDLGHYIGDGHVPLHTTTNYNGQLTDQVGIHGFWESRIPELFADAEYDYFVGSAQYISNIDSFYWAMVLESHSYVDSVLSIEKRLSQSFPADRQYCYEDRNFVNVRMPCPEYARAYSDAMKDMVESRFRSAIYSVGSAWYTAWVDAGSPKLTELEQTVEVNSIEEDTQELPANVRKNIREHED